MRGILFVAACFVAFGVLSAGEARAADLQSQEAPVDAEAVRDFAPSACIERAQGPRARFALRRSCRAAVSAPRCSAFIRASAIRYASSLSRRGRTAGCEGDVAAARWTPA